MNWEPGETCPPLPAVGNRNNWRKELKRGTRNINIKFIKKNEHGFLGRRLSLCARDAAVPWFFWLFDIWCHQRKCLIILLMRFRTAHCSFRVGPILVVDEPFTVGFAPIIFVNIIDVCLELDGNFCLFCSDWQWSDDTHHENKKGQSDRQVQEGDRSLVQVRRGVQDVHTDTCKLQCVQSGLPGLELGTGRDDMAERPVGEHHETCY